VQDTFRERTGLLLDVVEQGSGTTNNGNSARRFFEDFALASEITGIDKTVIFRLGVILNALASPYEVDCNKFKVYTRHTYELLVEKYPWYYVPQGVHRILMHGHAVIEKSPLPTGMMSEEAQEARNKDYRYFR